ncbi:DUF1045 domain-containing protein [Methylopila henanensis]|uniref:DUF1045 domain-containing protein n=1 Tax=Methylopila henanensis TaxID=873516 RepID=A0ABW4K4R2_9HYPH
MTAPRYAIYYAPAPGSPLWSFGSSVLGYDAATGADIPALAPHGISQDAWRVLTETPRRYGFHATLKAPFRLAEGRTEDDLVAAGRAFARSRKPFLLPELEVVALGAFVGLQPKQRSAELDDLANGCVEAFEPFRAPAGEAELARRLESPLSDRQKAALDLWGYPYVFDDFHFHMTLTGPLHPEMILRVRAGLSRLHEDHVAFASTQVDAVALFVQDRPDEGFRIVDRFVFAG